jgi:peptidoglycan biosynthesis protein MviN/MurJ (putative lipid II flippase)
VGLALAYGVAYTAAALLSFALLLRRSPGFDRAALFGTTARLSVAALVMGAAVVGMEKLVHPLGNALVTLTIVASMTVGAIVYFGMVIVLRVPGIDELASRLPILRNRRAAT